MKKTLIATTIALAATTATTAFAETAAAPVMDITVITQDAGQYAGPDWLVPLVLIGLAMMLASGAAGGFKPR